jgi:hypothetical protein
MNLRFARSALACGLVLLSATAPATAYAFPLLAGLGGPADYGPGNLPGNDDGSSQIIDVSAAFPQGLNFFGMTFMQLYVNNNGNITFGGPLGTFTPQAFPVASQRMIAPWWGDVDTRTGGVPNRNGVYWSITPGQFVATWHDVGYYAEHDNLENDFQLILRTAGPSPGDFDVEFRYNRCEWTTGDASGGSGGFGGTPAQAGFDAGNNRDYVSLPGSLTMQILDVCTTSNVGVPGVWRYAIRSGDVTCPGFGTACTTGMPGICGAGTIHCMGVSGFCAQNMMAMPEVCNGADDDCDAMTDEDLGSTTCGIGDCVTSTQNCVGGMTQTCVPLPPHDEVCDLHDNDCDGQVDEDQAEIWCGLGICRRATPGCIMGTVPVCVPGMPMPETCNGMDNDCDGVIGNGLDACNEPDAFVAPDAWVHPDLGIMDAGPATDTFFVPPDGCHGLACDPWRLNGRAGPGCSCRVGQRSEQGLLVIVVGGVMAIVSGRRRKR